MSGKENLPSVRSRVEQDTITNVLIAPPELKYRLMSGLQGSITTQVAKEYLDVNTGEWFENIPLFVKAVGAHKERVENLYFSFLFVLRAVAKAEPLLLRYNYSSGVTEGGCLSLLSALLLFCF